LPLGLTYQVVSRTFDHTTSTTGSVVSAHVDP